VIAVSVRAPHAAAIGAEDREGERDRLFLTGGGSRVGWCFGGFGGGGASLSPLAPGVANGHRDFLKPVVQGAAANDESVGRPRPPWRERTDGWMD
jgi:hypothetical protein